MCSSRDRGVRASREPKAPCPQVPGSAGNECVPPPHSYAERLCPSLCEYAKRPPPPPYTECLCPHLCEYTVCPAVHEAPMSPSPCEYKVCPSSISGPPRSVSAGLRCLLPPNADGLCPRVLGSSSPVRCNPPPPTPPSSPAVSNVVSSLDSWSLSPSLGQKKPGNPRAPSESPAAAAQPK